jgi:predicted DNA-binding transcriptional regulator YafY
MQSDRLLSVLLLLQTHGRLSARELAKRLEVSDRTIYRDVDALSRAGVPVYAERGRHGGCALLPGYRTDLSGLTTTEARALFIFTGRGTLADLGLERDLRAAFRKLLAGLPEPHRPDAMQAQERVVVDPRGWSRPADEVPWLGTVQEAVWSDRQLHLLYRSSGTPSARGLVVDPYGLVAKSGVWYLLAAEDGEPRLFRVSRVEEATVLDAPSARPIGLDLEALWEQLRRRVEERAPGCEVTLRVRPERRDLLLRICASQLAGPVQHLEEPDPAGWARLRLSFPAIDPARGTLLGFGVEVEVLDPPELRREMADTARALVDLYG